MEISRLVRQVWNKDVCTSVCNPQPNEMYERMYQTIGDILCITSNTNPPNDIDDANQVMDNALAVCMYTLMRSNGVRNR